MKREILIAFALLVTHTSLSGTPWLQDDFSMDGTLNGQFPDVGSPWVVSGANLSTSGSALKLPNIDGEASSSFASQSNVTLFAGISFSVTQSPSMSGSFFFSFLSGPMTVGRLFVTSTGSSGTFNIGVENNLDNPVSWTSALTVGVTYRAVVGFTEDGGSDVSRLWVNPVTINSSSIADASETVVSSIDGIRLRSSDPFPSSSTGTEIWINKIYVGDSFEAAAAVPESNTLVLFTGLVVLAFVFLGSSAKSMGKLWFRQVSKLM